MMPPAIVLGAVVVGSYLIGSIPFGYLAGRCKGVDIRDFGSGNIGATNVLRVLGKRWGIPVFICDAAKGLLAVWVSMWGVRHVGVTPLSAEMVGIVGAVSCIVGHNFTCWLGFKGGKGVATSAGVLIGLMPVEALIVVTVWAIVFLISRYVSLASLMAAVSLPISLLFAVGPHGARSSPLFYFSLLISALVVWRHRANVQRLIAGTENRFEKRKPNGAE